MAGTAALPWIFDTAVLRILREDTRYRFPHARENRCDGDALSSRRYSADGMKSKKKREEKKRKKKRRRRKRKENEEVR